jgi:Toastrack DUF4097
VQKTTSLMSRTYSHLHSKAQPPRLAPALARLFLALAAVLCLALPGFADVQVFEQTYPLASGGQFVLQNVNGSVRVEGWDRNEVEVRAVKTSASDARDLALVKIDVQSHPGEVDVHTLYPDGENAEVAVEYVVHVPYRVLLHSIRTVNGSVSVRGVQGAGELKSVNGNVEVLNSSGRFSARTTNGNLHLELCSLTAGAPMDLETVNGSVTLGLPSNASADLSVRNMNGDVSSDVPVTSTVALPGAQILHGRLGHGGNPISLRTVNGGIRLLLEHPGV